MEGWIVLWRKIRESSIWLSNDKFDKRSAFIDLILSANYKCTTIIFDNKNIHLQAGEFITSMRKLSDRWKWSVTKVDNFLKLLESDGTITCKKDSKKTRISINNWGFYQCGIYQEMTQEKHKKDAEKKQKETDNNDNKYINNNIYSEEEIYNAMFGKGVGR